MDVLQFEEMAWKQHRGIRKVWGRVCVATDQFNYWRSCAIYLTINAPPGHYSGSRDAITARAPFSQEFQIFTFKIRGLYFIPNYFKFATDCVLAKVHTTAATRVCVCVFLIYVFRVWCVCVYNFNRRKI